MSRIEKISWIMLIFCGIGLLGLVLLVSFVGIMPDIRALFEHPVFIALAPAIVKPLVIIIVATFVGEFLASAVFGFLGFAGLIPAVFMKKKLLDERDRIILKRAQLIGYLVFWGFFFFAIMGAWGWYYYRNIHAVPVEYLPLTVFAGGWIFVTVQSLATIVLCRRGVIDGES